MKTKAEIEARVALLEADLRTLQRRSAIVATYNQIEALKWVLGRND